MKTRTATLYKITLNQYLRKSNSKQKTKAVECCSLIDENYCAPAFCAMQLGCSCYYCCHCPDLHYFLDSPAAEWDEGTENLYSNFHCCAIKENGTTQISNYKTINAEGEHTEYNYRYYFDLSILRSF